MMEGFKMFGGYSIQDLKEYCISYVKQYPDVELYVGCDSANLRKNSMYALTICFRHPGNGVHVIFKRFKIEKIRDIFTRLWNEVEYVKELAEYLDSIFENVRNRNGNDKFVIVDLDFNKSERFKSHKVYEAGVGYLTGLGYKVRTKPDSVAATSAADLLLKV